MDLPQIGKPAPNFQAKAVLNNKVFELSSSDYEDKYLILIFYPMDL
jgi:peroxiredoxin (alkyl hydroperoxide reductase subunit C)